MSTDTHFQFYAIVEDDAGERDLFRIRIEKSVDQKVAELFEDQASDLLNEDLERIEYDPGYRPEDNEIFEINPFSLPLFLRNTIEAPNKPDSVSEADIERGRIKALLACEFPWQEQRSRVLFQNFDLRQTLSKSKWFFLLGNQTFTRLDVPGLGIGSKLTAAYVGGSLLFRSDHMTRRFLEIDGLFEEATAEQVKSLLSHRLFSSKGIEDVLDTADHWVRRKVASIMRRQTLDRVSLDEIDQVATEFQVDLEVVTEDGEEKIVVPTERRELKRLVRLLDEDLYASPLTGDHFQANSKRKLTS